MQERGPFSCRPRRKAGGGLNDSMEPRDALCGLMSACLSPRTPCILLLSRTAARMISLPAGRSLGASSAHSSCSPFGHHAWQGPPSSTLLIALEKPGQLFKEREVKPAATASPTHTRDTPQACRDGSGATLLAAKRDLGVQPPHVYLLAHRVAPSAAAHSGTRLSRAARSEVPVAVCRGDACPPYPVAADTGVG